MDYQKANLREIRSQRSGNTSKISKKSGNTSGVNAKVYLLTSILKEAVKSTTAEEMKEKFNRHVTSLVLALVKRKV